jgi:uncharacterized protein
VPFLYLLMATPEWSGVDVADRHQAALAHATSLALIVPTAISGVVSYARRGLIDRSTVLTLGLASGVAAFVGARVAVLLPSEILKVAFALFLLAMGAHLARGRRAGVPEVERQGVPVGSLRLGVALMGGALVGFLSAVLGVGGGIVAIPILIYWARMDLHRATAASLGVIVFAAIAGTASYAVAGQGVEGLPTNAIGYVHLTAFVAMLPGAILCAPLGVRLNRRLPTRALERIFAALLLLMGLRLLWTNVPALSGIGP